MLRLNVAMNRPENRVEVVEERDPRTVPIVFWEGYASAVADAERAGMDPVWVADTRKKFRLPEVQ